MWYFVGTHSRILLSKVCPRQSSLTKTFQRNVRHIGKQQLSKPIILSLTEKPSWKDLIKPIFFTLGFSTTVISGCFVWKYENMRRDEKKKNNFLEYFRNLPESGVSPKVRKNNVLPVHTCLNGRIDSSVSSNFFFVLKSRFRRSFSSEPSKTLIK